MRKLKRFYTLCEYGFDETVSYFFLPNEGPDSLCVDISVRISRAFKHWVCGCGGPGLLTETIDMGPLWMDHPRKMTGLKDTGDPGILQVFVLEFFSALH